MPIELRGVKPAAGKPDRRYYMIRVQVAGRRAVVSTDTRKKDLAERKEAQLLEALRENPSMTQAEIVALVRGSGSQAHRTAIRSSGGLTLHQAFQRCLSNPVVWGSIRSKTGYMVICATIERVIGGDMPLAAITGQTIDRLRDTLLAEGILRPNGTKAPMAGATVNRHLAALRRMFHVATGRAKGCNQWPDAPLTLPYVAEVPERGPREYFLPPEDEKRLMAAMEALDKIRPGEQGGPPRRRDAHRYRLLFSVMLETGLRKGEALRLRWEDISLPRAGGGEIKLLRKSEIKTGRKGVRVIPITPLCREALEACKGVAHGPFSDCDRNRANDVWDAAKKLAGITHPDCVPHCLRHACASRLLDAGVNPFIVQDWMGHANIETTRGYSHTTSRALVGAADALVALRTKVEAG